MNSKPSEFVRHTFLRTRTAAELDRYKEVLAVRAIFDRLDGCGRALSPARRRELLDRFFQLDESDERLYLPLALKPLERKTGGRGWASLTEALQAPVPSGHPRASRSRPGLARERRWRPFAPFAMPYCPSRTGRETRLARPGWRAGCRPGCRWIDPTSTPWPTSKKRPSPIGPRRCARPPRSKARRSSTSCWHWPQACARNPPRRFPPGWNTARRS
jgi:hypothetical protein